MISDLSLALTSVLFFGDRTSFLGKLAFDLSICTCLADCCEVLELFNEEFVVDVVLDEVREDEGTVEVVCISCFVKILFFG